VTTDDHWQQLRAEMPVARNWAYLDHASVAPLPEPAAEAIRDWCRDAVENGVCNWSRWRAQVEQARKLLAQLLNVPTSEIAIIRNTTEGIGLVAEGLSWQPGDNVVVPAGEFPSNLYPWFNLQSRGVEVRLVTPHPDETLEEAASRVCDSKTRIVAVSWVDYATGRRQDPDEWCEIAHSHDALLFLDAIQGLGALPIDLSTTPVDFLAADGHKWLMGPEGAGTLYIRQERLNTLRPLGVGWNSVRHAGDFTRIDLDLKDNAGRYEGGSYNMAGIIGLRASLEFLARPGRTAVGERVLELQARACERLEHAGCVIQSDRHPNRSSGIVGFAVPWLDARDVKRHCQQQGVVVNERGGCVRISAHVWNDDSDIDRLVDALEMTR